MSRVYLDWNATAPLRPEARAAMLSAMEAVGNPSSVHAEGRGAKAIVERARAQIAAAVGASNSDIVFTSGATEAAALALAGRDLASAAVEHDCVGAWTHGDLSVDQYGAVEVSDPAQSTVQVANSETGVVAVLPEGLAVTDAVQAIGKVPFAFSWSGADMAFVSAHKFGGPKGVGALVLKQGLDPKALLKGGGQEMGWRAGTENIIGIAGMGAAAEAALRDLEAGVMDAVAERRDALEVRLKAGCPDLILMGEGAKRLPNTSCFAVPGWKGETQVMQMDLAGFAISAGSACSSGKVKASKVIRAMGHDELTASSVVRVSIGTDTTMDELDSFATAWLRQYEKFRARAA
ncbi:cysteine desulfurase family protein [Pontivivens insulae]|uniref:Cysteine desulfurase n=1 Tax=Pontivivens insulae TaxID=1639689 RepID=A0A2R8AB80_9RHOB|nr:aminotransferase class V-fold PLP-dependent enzyme [Pontivivens insulae]RED13246.1 cysteine desulfurase [Pontivivens insulae]SPF29338.1 Cysteine desulfurase NifS [Pontivivens insulae]